MKQTLLLLMATIPYASFSQDNSEVARWVANHPNVYIISSDNYQKMSETRKEQLKDQIIVFNGELKMEQLVAYSQEKSIPLQSDSPTKPQDAQEIKDWIGMHQNVQIIKRSVFESFSPEDQQIYLTNGSLILSGESITIRDIRNY